MRSPLIKNANNISVFYENGDVYTGSLSRGKRNGFGIYNDFIAKSIYNGFWENDMVSIRSFITRLFRKKALGA